MEPQNAIPSRLASDRDCQSRYTHKLPLFIRSHTRGSDPRLPIFTRNLCGRCLQYLACERAILFCTHSVARDCKPYPNTAVVSPIEVVSACPFHADSCYLGEISRSPHFVHYIFWSGRIETTNSIKLCASLKLGVQCVADDYIDKVCFIILKHGHRLVFPMSARDRPLDISC